MTRLIDADALSALLGDERSTLHKEQTTFKAMTQSEFDTKDNMLLNFQQFIDNAPTVERPSGKWIPVSERLPEYSGLYLISIDDLVTVATFTGTYFLRRGGWIEVDAWQPLPRPYEGGTQ